MAAGRHVAVLPTAKSLSAFSLKPQSDRLLGSPLDYQSASLFQRSGIQYCARDLATRISFEGDPGVISAVNMKFTAGYSFQTDGFALLEIQDRPRSRRFCNQIPGVYLDLQLDAGNVDRRPRNIDIDQINLRARNFQPGLRVDRASQPRDDLAQRKPLDRGPVDFLDDITRFQSSLGRGRIIERPKNSRAAACRFDVSADPEKAAGRTHPVPRT